MSHVEVGGPTRADAVFDQLKAAIDSAWAAKD
jgi:hypothetical protein